MGNHNSNHDNMIDISELVKNVKNRLNNQNIKNSNDSINRLGSEKYNNDKTMGKNTENKGNSSKTIGKYMVKKEELKNNKNNNNSNNNTNGKNNKHEVIAKIEYLPKNNDNNNYNENNNNNINNKNDKDNYYNNEHNNFESQLNLNNPNYYINRELSWLEFNKRVLEESSDESNPLLERLKFLAIFNSNLDEFFMIRVAGLKQRVSANILEKSSDGLTPYEQLVEIHKKTKKLLKYSELQYNVLIDQLRNHGIYIHKFSEIDHDLKHQAKEYFKKYILPVLTPLGIDATHPFPHVVNLGFNILIEINSEEGIKLGLVPIPKNIPRFIEIYNDNENGKNNERHFILLEELIMEHINKLFPHQDIKRMITFRLTRDADIRIQEDEADDLLEEIEKGLKERRFGKAVRLEIYENSGKGGNKYLQEFLKDEYDLEDMDIYKMKIPLNLTDLWQLYECIDNVDLKYKPYMPYLSSIFDIDIFSTLKSKDLVLFLPYDSFEPIIDFLNDAAENPDVLAIKIVLYRTGRHSPIIDALKKAVRNGKEVTAIIELKARFDEESNISWAKCLEEEGVHVVYGIPKLKIHAKMIMVVKKEDGGIKRYVHLGTGNYNHTTAKVYSDLGIMSSDEILGKDVEKIFNAITGYFQHPKLNKIYISPHKLKERVIECIRNEANHGSNGRIIAKMNSLVDMDVIKELYRASQKGVEIDLIVRGICCLKPGIKGISDNIRVRSIVGKYLEHARVFYFKNNGDEILYLSSADWMPRNFNKRVETMFPVESNTIKEYIKEILNIQLRDTTKARIMQPDGTYIRTEQKNCNSQEYFEKWVKLKDINNI